MFGIISELVPQNRLQISLFKNLNNQLQELNTIIKLAQTIKLNIPYNVSAMKYHIKNNLIMIFTGYNLESFKCQVLADEFASPSKILWEYNKHKNTNINFKSITDFKEFKEEDAPLIVNWNYVSPEFKEKYFKSW